MNDRTPASSPPKFCIQDGMQLQEKRTRIPMGFDPFSGIERPAREHVTLVCQTGGHTVWVLADDGEAWLRL